MDEYAIVIDEPRRDVVILRDTLRHASRQHFDRAEKAKSHVIRQRNMEKYEVLGKYAERLEDIRLDEARAITKALGISQD